MYLENESKSNSLIWNAQQSQCGSIYDRPVNLLYPSYPKYVSDPFQTYWTLLWFMLWTVVLFSKFGENPTITLWVILFTNRQTDRQTAVKTVPRLSVAGVKHRTWPVDGGGNIGKERWMEEEGMMDGHQGWLKTLLDNAECKKGAEATAERQRLTCVAMHQLHLWILPATVVTRYPNTLAVHHSRAKRAYRSVHA